MHFCCLQASEQWRFATVTQTESLLPLPSSYWSRDGLSPLRQVEDLWCTLNCKGMKQCFCNWQELGIGIGLASLKVLLWRCVIKFVVCFLCLFLEVYLSILWVRVFGRHVCVPGASGGQQKPMDPLELGNIVARFAFFSVWAYSWSHCRVCFFPWFGDIGVKWLTQLSWEKKAILRFSTNPSGAKRFVDGRRFLKVFFFLIISLNLDRTGIDRFWYLNS